MGTQIQNSPSKSLKGTLARIMVALLLVLLALPVFYLGILGIYSLFWKGFAITCCDTCSVECGWNKFRHALVLAGALAVFYLGWAFIVYPFSGLLPNSLIHWSWAIMYWSWAIMCHSMPESGLDSLVAAQRPGVKAA